MRVAIIVDDLDPTRRRTSFWEEHLAPLEGITVELVSLLTKMDERKFFDVYRYDVVIFNWCVLDGALMYGSDRTQQIVEFYDDHFRRFVKKGKLLILENQPKRWHPNQKAYDTLFRNEILVETTDEQVFGDQVTRSPRLLGHPLLQHLPVHLYSNYPHTDVAWFPPGSTGEASLAGLHPRKMYSGGFKRWRPDWLPLMYDEKGEFPVMLAKTDGLGLYLVTTMYLGSSNVTDLLDAIFVEWPNKRGDVVGFHEKYRKHRRWSLVRLIAASALAAAAVAALFITDIIHLPDSFGGTIFGDIVVSVLFGVLVFGATRLGKYLLELAREALNR